VSTITWDQELLSALPASAADVPPKPTPLGERTELEIIRLAQSGDAAAFEHLYAKHSRRVYAVCLRMTGNPPLAEDLTQEAFLQVFRKIHTFRAESAFSTWLHRLAVNIVLMRRRVKHLNETPLDAPFEIDGETLPAREMGTVDSGVSGLVDRLNLERALGELPPGYRRAFVLHDVLGYEHHEIAQALGCSIGTSKSQLHKARMRLRKILRSAARPKLSIPKLSPSMLSLPARE
jgi:RNA polymerase sigma-70 factor, ECF subfamily